MLMTLMMVMMVMMMMVLMSFPMVMMPMITMISKPPRSYAAVGSRTTVRCRCPYLYAAPRTIWYHPADPPLPQGLREDAARGQEAAQAGQEAVQ